MNEVLPVLYLARHGETAWSLSGLSFATVLTSPLQRAVRTCALAGFGAKAEVDRDVRGGGMFSLCRDEIAGGAGQCPQIRGSGFIPRGSRRAARLSGCTSASFPQDFVG